MSTEKDIENAILEYLKLAGIYCWKNQSIGIYDPSKKTFRSRSRYQIKGVSDILGILPGGRFLALEVKRDKTYPTKEQKEFINMINEMGGYAGIVRSVDDIMDVVRLVSESKQKRFISG